MGMGKVRDVAPLSKTVFVALDDHGVKEFGADEIEVIQSNQNFKGTRQGPEI